MAGHLSLSASRVASLSSQSPRPRLGPKFRPGERSLGNGAIQEGLWGLPVIFRTFKEGLFTGI